MFQIITRNFFWKLASVVLATVLWLLLHNETPPSASRMPDHVFPEPFLSRDVPIEVRLTGVPLKGYQMTSVEAVPGVQRVTGPQPLVSAIEKISTQPVDITGLSTARTFTTTARPVTQNVYLESPAEVRVHVVVQQKR